MTVNRRVRRTRPVVLILVYGVFLVLIGITATAQSVLVSQHFTSSMLNSVVGNDSATVRTFVNGNLVPGDLSGSPLDPATVQARQEQLAALAGRGHILRVEIRAPDGTILLSDRPEVIGLKAPLTAAFTASLTGVPRVDLGTDTSQTEATGPGLGDATALREYLPIVSDGSVKAVFSLWRDATPILDSLEAVRRDVLIVTLMAGLIAAGILFLVFRGAQARITRQTAELIEATRRDALTGMLNHGAVVELLSEAIESARSADENVTVALLDIDNFRLLNETHGHAAGDRALLLVAKLLQDRLTPDVSAGRYGPDEFLLIAPPSAAASLEPALALITAGLVDLSLQFGASERLPVTISGGIATYPDHANSATELLSTAALTLANAKASGGNAIRMTDVALSKSSSQQTFDVFQGLIIAVDTKDRYTKRHSEDVARYSLFLADRLGLESESRDTLRLAGLLHDVGKIGIPDDILRKPGDLTDAEQAIVEQHVALGDAIVRNLPNVHHIRAAVRHHHERWDGRGYLDHLSGVDIPLIARIIAVGDVFSAMTTTRPYRKALTVDAALTRLEDAAGSQLDETLVRAFVEGIRTAQDPPLPGEYSPAATLWTPASQVA